MVFIFVYVFIVLMKQMYVVFSFHNTSVSSFLNIIKQNKLNDWKSVQLFYIFLKRLNNFNLYSSNCALAKPSFRD